MLKGKLMTRHLFVTPSTNLIGETGSKNRAPNQSCLYYVQLVFAIFLQNKLNSDVARFSRREKSLVTLFCCETEIRASVERRATSLFNSLCRNVTKKVARSLLGDPAPI